MEEGEYEWEEGESEIEYEGDEVVLSEDADGDAKEDSGEQEVPQLVPIAEETK